MKYLNILLTVCLVGCNGGRVIYIKDNSMLDYQSHYLINHPDLPSHKAKLIRRNKVDEGFTREETIVSIGLPFKEERIEGYEVWFYPDKQIWFENGILKWTQAGFYQPPCGITYTIRR